MPSSEQRSAGFPFLTANLHGVSLNIDFLPSAIAIWNKDRSRWYLNAAARKLTGLSDRDDPSVWLDRIHPQDRRLFSDAWKRLLDGKAAESCEYRFSPCGKDNNFVWLRELSVVHPNPPSGAPCIVSDYIDAGKFKEGPAGSSRENVQGIIAGLLHNVRNHLQTVRMGLDCLERLPAKPEDVQPLIDGVERVLALLRQLGDYFFPSEAKFLMADVGIVFEEVVRHMESALRRQKIRLRVEQRSALPPVRIDLIQFRRALERVMEVACALLPQGGDMGIETGTKELDGRKYIELKIVTFSGGALSLDDKELFRPFLRVNGYEVGLNIVIADQIIRRHDGKILFQKEDSNRGRFSILLEVVADEAQVTPTIAHGATNGSIS